MEGGLEERDGRLQVYYVAAEGHGGSSLQVRQEVRQTEHLLGGGGQGDAPVQQPHGEVGRGGGEEDGAMPGAGGQRYVQGAQAAWGEGGQAEEREVAVTSELLEVGEHLGVDAMGGILVLQPSHEDGSWAFDVHDGHFKR